MNTQEKEQLISFINEAKEDLRFDFGKYHRTHCGYVHGTKLIEYIKHLYEQQEVKVPECADKWIIKCRALQWNIWDLLAPEAFESSFARDTEEWLRQDKQNYDILARAWLEGYEVEEEPKWVVKVGNLYFCGWEDTTAQFVMNTVLGEDESIIKYKNEGTASSVAKNLGGTAEKA